MKKINKIMILIFTAFLILAGACDKKPDTAKGGATAAPAGEDDTASASDDAATAGEDDTASASDDAATTGEDDTASVPNNAATDPFDKECQEQISAHQSCIAIKVHRGGCDGWYKHRFSLIPGMLPHGTEIKLKYITLSDFIEKCQRVSISKGCQFYNQYGVFLALYGRGFEEYHKLGHGHIIRGMQDDLKSVYEAKRKTCSNELPDPS